MPRIERLLTEEERQVLVQVLDLDYSHDWVCIGCGRASQPLYLRRKAKPGPTKVRCLECWHRDQRG